jgi:DNA-binding response OmpR family regulator
MVTVLIIDDEPKLVDVISSYLEIEGFHTIKGYTGKELLNHIDHSSVDLIILDLILPDISGEELCQIIRQQHSIPIIILSAKTREDERIFGLSVGADDYMAKPFSPVELVLRVKNILRRSNVNFE